MTIQRARVIARIHQLLYLSVDALGRATDQLPKLDGDEGNLPYVVDQLQKLRAWQDELRTLIAVMLTTDVDQLRVIDAEEGGGT